MLTRTKAAVEREAASLKLDQLPIDTLTQILFHVSEQLEQGKQVCAVRRATYLACERTCTSLRLAVTDDSIWKKRLLAWRGSRD